MQGFLKIWKGAAKSVKICLFAVGQCRMQLLYTKGIQLASGVEMSLFYRDFFTGKTVASTAKRASVTDFMSAGVNISDALGLDAVEFMRLTERGALPIAIVTERGVGVISPVFYLSSGLCVYAHVGGRRSSVPRVLARLDENGLCSIIGEKDSSPMRDEDIPTYRAVEELIFSFDGIVKYTSDDYVGFGEDGFNYPKKDYSEMAELIESLAEFCGADVNIESAFENGVSKCASTSDMRSLICVLLICIAAAKANAVDGINICVGEEGGVWKTDVEFTYRDKGVIPAGEALEYLGVTADVTGMKFAYSTRSVSRPENFKRGKFAAMRLTTVYSSNPDIGVAWGVKAGNVLSDIE